MQRIRLIAAGVVLAIVLFIGGGWFFSNFHIASNNPAGATGGDGPPISITQTTLPQNSTPSSPPSANTPSAPSGGSGPAQEIIVGDGQTANVMPNDCVDTSTFANIHAHYTVIPDNKRIRVQITSQGTVDGVATIYRNSGCYPET